jgi:outer membrane protein assembly factor BamB
VRTIVWVALLAGLVSAEDWRYPRGDLANTGVVRNKGPLKPPTVVWKREVAGSVVCGPALYDGRVFFGAGEYSFLCHRVTSGERVWEKKVKQQIVASPLVEGNFVYVGGQDGVHYRIGLKDASEPNPVYAEGSITASSAVIDDYLVAGSMDGNFYAINASKGGLLWKRATGSIRHGAAVDRRHAYVATENGVLFAFHLKKGEELWKHDANAMTRSAPILGRGVVYHVTTENLQVLSAKNGEAVATHDLKIATAPVLDRSLLHYGTAGGEVVTFDLKKKKELRRVKIADTAVSTPLIEGNGVLYGAAGAKLFAVSAKDGEVLWTYDGEMPWAPPIVADRKLYAGAAEAFYCLK